MAASAPGQFFLTIHGTSWTDKAVSVSLNSQEGTIDGSTFDDVETRPVGNGIFSGSFSMTFFIDYTAGGSIDLIEGILGSTVEVVHKPKKDDPTSAANPKRTAKVFCNGYPVFNPVRGQRQTGSVNWQVVSEVKKATSD